MTLYRIIGAACLDAEFCEALFSDWATAVRDYGLGHVTDAEEKVLARITKGDQAADMKARLGALRAPICPTPPDCPRLRRLVPEPSKQA